MRIEKLAVRNFRALADVTLDFGPSVTALVGTNNAGKTTVLDALGSILMYRGALALSEADFRSTNPGQAARQCQPIEIELHIAPTSTDSHFEPGELGSHTAQVRPDGAERFYLRLTTRWNADPTVNALETTLVPLRIDGQTLPPLQRFPFPLELPLHAFGAERDLRRGLGGRASDWSRILSESRPDDTIRTAAMLRLRSASGYLLRNTPGLAEIRDALGTAGTITGIGEMGVQLSAAPDDVDELIRRIAIELRLPGAKRPFGAERHGLGTQGAVLFAIYKLHADRMRAGRSFVSPIMTIEEPEAHLHPTAQRALGRSLTNLPGQVIITTHSPEMIVDGVRPILLRNIDGSCSARTSVWPVPKARSAHALFARCVLISEGLEGLALESCAKAMGFDLHGRGVEIVDARGQTNIVELWERLGPPGFGAPVVCFADADVPSELQRFLSALVTHGILPQMPPTTSHYATLRQHGYFVPLNDRNIEEALAETCPAVIDSILDGLEGIPFSTWRSMSKSQKLKRNLCNRVNVRRGAGRPQLTYPTATVSDLTVREARYYRLTSSKSRVPDVISKLTNGGTDASKLPAGLRQMLRFVERATRFPP